MKLTISANAAPRYGQGATEYSLQVEPGVIAGLRIYAPSGQPDGATFVAPPEHGGGTFPIPAHIRLQWEAAWFVHAYGRRAGGSHCAPTRQAAIAACKPAARWQGYMSPVFEEFLRANTAETKE